MKIFITIAPNKGIHIKGNREMLGKTTMFNNAIIVKIRYNILLSLHLLFLSFLFNIISFVL